MDLVMQVEIPIALYGYFAEQAELRDCTVEEIVRETMQKFLAKENWNARRNHEKNHGQCGC